MCVCVVICLRKETRERDGGRERESEKGRSGKEGVELSGFREWNREKIESFIWFGCCVGEL